MRAIVFAVALLAVGIQPGGRAASPSVSYLPAADVWEAFAKGRPLIETTAYKIHASRREGPGMAEIHTRDTDIVYVLEGTATLVTGGDAAGATMTAESEWRGSAIVGGESRQLSKGDVIVIPNGVPHLFKETSRPFLYYVVKVTAPAAGGTR